MVVQVNIKTSTSSICHQEKNLIWSVNGISLPLAMVKICNHGRTVKRATARAHFQSTAENFDIRRHVPLLLPKVLSLIAYFITKTELQIADIN